MKSQIPIRTWPEWDDARPGFLEIDLVGHEGRNPFGEFCFTLTMTDVAEAHGHDGSGVGGGHSVLERLDEIPGVGPRAAQIILAAVAST